MPPPLVDPTWCHTLPGYNVTRGAVDLDGDGVPGTAGDGANGAGLAFVYNASTVLVPRLVQYVYAQRQALGEVNDTCCPPGNYSFGECGRVYTGVGAPYGRPCVHARLQYIACARMRVTTCHHAS